MRGILQCIALIYMAVVLTVALAILFDPPDPTVHQFMPPAPPEDSYTTYECAEMCVKFVDERLDCGLRL